MKADDRHFYVVDLARGLAASAILFWHYKQFYYLMPGVQMLSAAQNVTQPGYGALWLLYDYGHYAVQFFWLISGFVFAAVYIGSGVKLRSFAVNRFARLYPLHFLTLLVLAGLQALSSNLTGQFQIYEYNDVYHFILNVFLASSWGLQKGYSFNGPIWSVSVEVLVYGLFCATLPFLYRRGVIGPLMLAIVAWVAAFGFAGHLHMLRECVFYFFAGVVVHFIFRRWRDVPVALLSAAAALAVVGAGLVRWGPRNPDAGAVPCLVLALLLICCALESSSVASIAKRIRWIGDSTYGIYLWHVPFQVVALIVFSQIDGARSVITQGWFLAFFLASVVGLARLSFLLFEHPIRMKLKKYAGPPSPGPKARGLDAIEEMAAP